MPRTYLRSVKSVSGDGPQALIFLKKLPRKPGLRTTDVRDLTLWSFLKIQIPGSLGTY